VALSGRDCPDCGCRVPEPFQHTITGREVCPDCADALCSGTLTGVITKCPEASASVWAVLLHRLIRLRQRPR
jgi:hypothetical protein